MRSRCAAGHARLPCDDPSAARYFERRCVCLILAVGVHLRYRTSQSTLKPGVFRRHAHSENSNSHTHEMYYQRFVGLSAQFCEKQGMLTSTSSSRRAATKSTAKALSLCGARCRAVWRSCAPELAPRCAAWCSPWGGIRAFKFSLTASVRRLGHARSSARARKSETSRAPPQVLAHGHTCSRKSGEALSSLGQHRACARVQRPAKR